MPCLTWMDDIKVMLCLLRSHRGWGEVYFQSQNKVLVQALRYEVIFLGIWNLQDNLLDAYSSQGLEHCLIVLETLICKSLVVFLQGCPWAIAPVIRLSSLLLCVLEYGWRKRFVGQLGSSFDLHSYSSESVLTKHFCHQAFLNGLNSFIVITSLYCNTYIFPYLSND